MSFSQRTGAHIRGNAVAYLALFVALAGTSYAATQITSKQIAKNAVKAKHIKDGQVKSAEVAENAIGAGELGDGAATTSKLADGAVTSQKIADEGVSGADVANPVRVVNLPIGSFLRDSEPPLDYTVSDGLAADLALVNSAPVIKFDDDSDGGGGDFGDFDVVEATFTVPPDYASGGECVFRVTKDAHAGVPERLGCSIFRNGGGQAGSLTFEPTTTAASTEYVVVPPATYSPGDSVSMQVEVTDASSGGATFDDRVRFHSIGWRYVASQ